MKEIKDLAEKTACAQVAGCFLADMPASAGMADWKPALRLTSLLYGGGTKFSGVKIRRFRRKRLIPEGEKKSGFREPEGESDTETMGLGRMLILMGAALVVIGLLVTFAERLPLRLGRLPGDIHIHGRNGDFYFPVVTCILLSAIFTLIMWLVRR